MKYSPVVIASYYRRIFSRDIYILSNTRKNCLQRVLHCYLILAARGGGQKNPLCNETQGMK